MRHLFTIGLLLAGLAIALMAPAAAHADTTNACSVPVDIASFGLKEFTNPEPIPSSGGVLTAAFNLGYSNPAVTKIGPCGLTLRTYNGRLIGPTLIAKPGDLLKFTVTNNLPRDPNCHDSNGDESTMEMGGESPPGIYNVTNFHTHGLHVSPGNNPDDSHQDNIFVMTCPGSTARYAIQIPANHPPGTFWYHAHIHGSTAIQVSSTVEGAIIIRGGLDNVPQIRAAREQIFVLQQISYDENGKIEDEGTMYDNWVRTGSRTIVNGQLVPLIKMHQGEVQRWRMIHAGVDQSLYMTATVAGPLYEIATDGIALGRLDVWKTPIDLEPGYRSDVLFKAPMRPGRYYLASAKIPANLGIARELVRGSTSAIAVPTGTDAKWIVAVDVDNVVHDMPLPTDADLRGLAPYKPITPDELTGDPQKMEFTLDLANCEAPGPCKPCSPEAPPACTYKYMVDWYVYPNGPTRKLALNKASQWTLNVTPEEDAHPYHIHVNHFEMVRPGPNGLDETVWKDTLMVRGDMAEKYRLIKSRYTDFTGAFVLHCHILPHEDNGMMQKVEIVP